MLQIPGLKNICPRDYDTCFYADRCMAINGVLDGATSIIAATADVEPAKAKVEIGGKLRVLGAVLKIDPAVQFHNGQPSICVQDVFALERAEARPQEATRVMQELVSQTLIAAEAALMSGRGNA